MEVLYLANFLLIDLTILLDKRLFFFFGPKRVEMKGEGREKGGHYHPSLKGSQ